MKAREDVELVASEVEAEAIGNAIQGVIAQAATREEQAAFANRRMAKVAKEAALAEAAKRKEQDYAARAKEAAASEEATKRQPVKDKGSMPQAAKANEEAARQAREAEVARLGTWSAAQKTSKLNMVDKFLFYRPPMRWRPRSGARSAA